MKGLTIFTVYSLFHRKHYTCLTQHALASRFSSLFHLQITPNSNRFPPLTRNVYMRYYHRYLLRVHHNKTDGAHLIFRPLKTKKSLIFWYVNRRNICIQNSVLFFNFSYLRCRVKINSFLQTRKELVNYLIGFFLQYSRAAKKSLLFCNSRKNHGRIWFDKHFVNLHCQEKRTL